jgi:hypothetical protein
MPTKAQDEDIDEKLWAECLSLMPESDFHDLPYLLGTLDGMKALLVDGNRVKVLCDMDFIEGGHGYVYDYIPKDEVWFDANAGRNNLPFIAYHEAYEIRLMKQGMDYDTAHEHANVAEKLLRRRVK